MKLPEIKISSFVNVNPNETALVIVDMINDFAHQDGSLFVPDAVETIPKISALALRAQNAGMPIFFVEDEHIKDDIESQDWPSHAIKGTWGASTVGELTNLKFWDDTQTVKKLRFDGFYNTDLEHRLRHYNEKTIKNVIIVGTVSHICVLSTAMGAGMRWINPIVPTDCISSLSEFGEFEELMTLHMVTTLFRGIATTSEGIKFDEVGNL